MLTLGRKLLRDWIQRQPIVKTHIDINFILTTLISVCVLTTVLSDSVSNHAEHFYQLKCSQYTY